MDDSFITPEFITGILAVADGPAPSAGDPARAQYELARDIATEHSAMRAWSLPRKLLNAKRVTAFGELLHRYHNSYGRA